VVLVSILDAAHLTRIPAGTIRRWVSKGHIPRYGPKPCKVNMLDIEDQATRRKELRQPA
jgi:hypothetical protein